MPPLSFPSQRFWSAILQLINDHAIIIDRPKGSSHPRYPDLIYPVDYGYLEGTASLDQGGIDVWRGSQTPPRLNGIICTVDLHKSDSEIKLLIGCSQNEISTIFATHNEFTQAGLWVPNPY